VITPDRFALTIQPIPGVDHRITRIAAKHAQTGEATTAGILFTGNRYAHDEVQQELLRLTDFFDLPGGHWHRLTETDGIPTYCNEPDPDGDGAWLKFAADYGISAEKAAMTLLDHKTVSHPPARRVA
jgi:hypothetical protein